MKTKILVFLLCSVYFAFTQVNAEIDSKKVIEEKELTAVEAAKSWVILVDEGKYNKSYLKAADYFKNAVTEEQWLQGMTATRNPLGKVLLRELKSKKYMTELPGAPDGEYVVIQFNTSFENKKSSVETITQMLEKDGTWKMSGYFIK